MHGIAPSLLALPRRTRSAGDMDAGAVGALATGVLAGLALVLPPGAVTGLLVDAGVSGGRRAAVPAAFGIATVDFVYALVAVLAGAALAAPLTHGAAVVRWISAAALIGFAAWRLMQLSARVAGKAPPPSAGRSYVRFVLLTAVNPLTVTYFAAVVAGLPGIASHPGPAKLAFALGTFAASASWHVALAYASTGVGRRLEPNITRAAAICGQVGIIVLAVTIAF
jgi:threonine/homoserine/homoserine lactone efflux protein